jgi:hypothetical protein
VAAKGGQLDTIRLSVEEHGEDVNGLSPTSQWDKGQLASWMPIHYAAHWGKGDAMKLLESYGARTGVADL